MNISSWAVANVLVSLLPVPCMLVPTCMFLTRMILISFDNLSSVLLDDCLAAVDSHVARHVFGMLHVFYYYSRLKRLQTTWLDRMVYYRQRLVSSSRIAYHLFVNSTLWSSFGAELSSRKVPIDLWSQTRTAKSQNLCKNHSPKSSFFFWFWLVSFGLCSKGHGTGSDTSGSSTPFFTSGSATPVDENQDSFLKMEEQVTALSEKLQHRESFHKAHVIATVSTHIPSKGLSKEHQEQGRVKIDVYKRYIQAASKVGFAFFLFATIAQQATSVMATLTLRYWGEHNLENGSNSGMFQYLLVYGLFSLSSSLLGAISAITMWVYCALKSSKRLHDSVSLGSL